MMFALGVVIAGCDPCLTTAQRQSPACQAFLESGPVSGPIDPDGGGEQQNPLPVATKCSQFALACFDELSRKRSALVSFVPGARWADTDLTWRLDKALSGFDEQEQLEILDRAFAMWADESALTFTHVEVDATIIISFESRDHGDPFPFDGAEGVLGHAFFPSSRTPGVIHLNADRFLSLNGSVGLDLFTAVLHEIGHALGVEHLSDKAAVMNADYRRAATELGDEDVDAIRRLYGDPKMKVVPVMVVPGQRPPPTLLDESETDSDGDGIPDPTEVFVFNTDPFLADTDGDGASDFEEIFQDMTDPLIPDLPGPPDRDNDGLPDHIEALVGTDPDCPDSDGDSLDDGREVLVLGTDPLKQDTDGDGQNDACDPRPLDPNITDMSAVEDDCSLCGNGTCDCGEGPVSCPDDCAQDASL